VPIRHQKSIILHHKSQFCKHFGVLMANKAPNKTPFSSAYEKGHFDGLVDEGKSLRQKLAFRAEFAKNTKPAKNL
jgi:hypothetical protein